MSITRHTEPSPAFIDAAARLYNAAFNVRTFYVMRAIFGDMPADEVDAIQLIKYKQYVYRGICNHELYTAHLGGDVEPSAIMVLKRPVDDGPPPDNNLPTPYDAELDACMPPDAEARAKLLDTYTSALKKLGYGDADKRNYHVSYLATAPSAQRRGLGSSLINLAMERARAEDREVSLSTHTAENAEFYMRLGFKIVGRDEWMIDSTPFKWWVMMTDMAGEGPTMEGTQPSQQPA